MTRIILQHNNYSIESTYCNFFGNSDSDNWYSTVIELSLDITKLNMLSIIGYQNFNIRDAKLYFESVNDLFLTYLMIFCKMSPCMFKTKIKKFI